MSVSTIEDLLDMEINYYLKVNYNALVKLVDALDGVDVIQNIHLQRLELIRIIFLQKVIIM